MCVCVRACVRVWVRACESYCVLCVGSIITSSWLGSQTQFCLRLQSFYVSKVSLFLSLCFSKFGTLGKMVNKFPEKD